MKTTHRQSQIRVLLLGTSIFCVVLSVVRSYLSGTTFYLFLNWNLILSILPWIISNSFIRNDDISKKNVLKKISLFMLWLLFFPNSLYIFTDLFHLRWQSSFPIWYDFVLITSFAWAGFVFGFISLLNVEFFLTKIMKQQFVNSILVVLLFLGSFGVYLGRFQRWNSWDIITQPFSLLLDIGDRIINPFSHQSTWGMTILMGVMLNIMFWSIKLLKQNNTFLHNEKLNQV